MTLLVSGGLDHTIKIWNPFSKSPGALFTLSRHKGTITTLSILNLRNLISSGEDNTLRIWDLPVRYSIAK